MNAPNLHLNLLHVSERQSSSPVRLRVMLPIFAALACVGCLVWWGVLECQLMLVKNQMASIQKEFDAKKAEYEDVRKQKDALQNAQAELDQLTMYANGRRTYGEMFGLLPTVIPEDMQLLSLEIPPPPLQNLLPPGQKPGPKVKPLLGPTNTVETVTLHIRGRVPESGAAKALKEALKKPEFSDVLVMAKDERLDQESRPSSPDGERQLLFHLEYRCRERRFEK